MKLRTALMSATLIGLAPMALADAHSGPRGRDGHVNIIYWQAPSILNTYLSGGTKDLQAASLVIEPLAGFDQDGTLFPRLAESIPTVANGGISADLTTITWKLKPGIVWSDGSPLTSADVVFTAEYCMHPEGGCSQLGKYEGVSKVEALDDLTVKVTFAGPKPYPYTAFVGAQAPIIQKAQFAECLGTKAPECTEANFNPIGTGPFVVKEFRTNDVIQMEASPNYREEGKPAFQTLTLKGGGDAAAAGRAVLETGEFDYAWNLQLAPDVLAGMVSAGKGKLVIAFGSLVERIEINVTDPSPDLAEGERSTAKHPHPIFSDIRVRKALSMAIDRSVLAEVGYGTAGQPTCSIVPAPAVYASANTECFAQDLEGARALLDEAGWTMGADGIREKDGKKLTLKYQTSTNAVRQDFQSLVQGWWSEIGVQTELTNIDASVYFGGDPNSPDTFQKFYADVEMYANEFDGTDPEPYLAGYTCDKAPKPESQWQGENINRFCDPKYDELVAKLGTTSSIEERGALAKVMNDMLTKDTYTIIPLVYRGRNSGHANSLGGVIINTWDSELWNAADWYRIKG